MDKQLNFNSKIKTNFNGGDLTSDAGLLLYKEFDETIGFSRLIKDKLKVTDSAKVRTHTNPDIALQKIYQIIAGYSRDDHADELRHDPVFTSILGKSELASQPTISRFNARLNTDNLKQFQEINTQLTDRIYKIVPPEQVIFDIDSTNFKTFGKQYGSDYNSHYASNGYHPLLMFDGLTGDMLKAELRSGNVYTSRQVVRFIGPELARYKTKYPNTMRIIRADSGFAVPELYDLIEENQGLYAIRLKANPSLYKLSKDIEGRMAELTENDLYSYQVIYGQFEYKATSWNKSRRVVVKLEKPEGQLTGTYTFVVTNMSSMPKEVIRFYSNRGTMENFIKEGKNGFSFDQMSSTDFIANANKLALGMLAYNLNNWLRRICFSKPLESNRIDNIRMKLIKIAAKIVRGSRYLTFKLCSSCPYKKAFNTILENIQQMSFAT